MRVRELAEWLGATFEGDGEREVVRAASLESAGAAELSFVGNRKAAVQALASGAGCLIVPAEFPNPEGRTLIRAPEPRAALAAPAARPSAGCIRWRRPSRACIPRRWLREARR